MRKLFLSHYGCKLDFSYLCQGEGTKNILTPAIN